MNEMYNRIEELCKKKKISITKMCHEAGVSRAPLTELKMGRTQKLSAENLDRIANYLGVTSSYLLGTEKEKAPTPEGESDNELLEYLQALKSRPEMKMLFHTFSGASKAEIEAIVLAWEARNNIKED